MKKLLKQLKTFKWDVTANEDFFTRTALKTDRILPLEGTSNNQLMQLSDHFRADQKLRQIIESIVQMPGEGDADLVSLVASDRMHGGGSELCPGRSRLDMRKHFLTTRVADGLTLEQAS